MAVRKLNGAFVMECDEGCDNTVVRDTFREMVEQAKAEGWTIIRSPVTGISDHYCADDAPEPE